MSGPDGLEQRQAEQGEQSARDWDEMDIADRLLDEARDSAWMEEEMAHAERLGAVFDQFLDRLTR